MYTHLISSEFRAVTRRSKRGKAQLVHEGTNQSGIQTC